MHAVVDAAIVDAEPVLQLGVAALEEAQVAVEVELGVGEIGVFAGAVSNELTNSSTGCTPEIVPR